MQLSSQPSQFYVCRDCNFVHTDPYDIDKCPYCKSDDWIKYKKEDENDWEEE